MCHFLPWGQHLCVVAPASQAPRSSNPPAQSALTEIPCTTVQQQSRAQACISDLKFSVSLKISFHSLQGCKQGRLKSQPLLLLPGCGDSTGSGMRESGTDCRGVNSQLFHMGSLNVCATQGLLDGKQKSSL